MDVNADQAEKFIANGGEKTSLAEATSTLDGVVVLNAVHTESVLFGEHGLVEHLKPGTVVVACATVPPVFAKDMVARCQERNV